MTIRRNAIVALAGLVASISATQVFAHPHVFADARLEVVSDGTAVTALRHVWRFDEFFTADVMLQFDKDGDGTMTAQETAAVADVIKQSTAEFNFFNNVYADGREVTMTVPGTITLDFADGQMLMIFETVPGREIRAAGRLSFGIFDPTFYTSIDFINDADMEMAGFPQGCSGKVVRPDPDEAIAQNQATLTEQFFTEQESNDLSRMFATRLEVTCA